MKVDHWENQQATLNVVEINVDNDRSTQAEQQQTATTRCGSCCRLDIHWQWVVEGFGLVLRWHMLLPRSRGPRFALPGHFYPAQQSAELCDIKVSKTAARDLRCQACMFIAHLSAHGEHVQGNFAPAAGLLASSPPRHVYMLLVPADASLGSKASWGGCGGPCKCA